MQPRESFIGSAAETRDDLIAELADLPSRDDRDGYPVEQAREDRGHLVGQRRLRWCERVIQIEGDQTRVQGHRETPGEWSAAVNLSIIVVVVLISVPASDATRWFGSLDDTSRTDQDVHVLTRGSRVVAFIGADAADARAAHPGESSVVEPSGDSRG
jgi:hypothetical protein